MLHSLRFRFTLICIGLAVGPLIITGVIIGARSFNTLEQQSLVLQSKVAKSVGSEISAVIERWENDLVRRGEMLGVGGLELKEQRVILSNLLLRQRDFQEVMLLNSEGREQIRMSRTSVILDDDLQSRAGSDEFLFPVTSGETYLGPVRFDDTIQEPLAIISVPLFDRRSGEVVSVLVAELRFKVIWDLLGDIELASEEDVYVIDGAGRVVAHRNPTIVLRGTTIELPEVDGRAEGLSGTDAIVARETIQFGDQELVVVAEQPVSSALKLATSSIGVAVIVISIALAFAVMLALFATRRIVRPIEALATSVRAISGGDFSQQVEVSSRDEVGQLASAFNQMVSDLRTTTTSINNLNKEITERKRMEEVIRESESKYRSLFDNMLSGFAYCKILVDENNQPVDFVYLDINDAFERLTGLKREDVIGRKVTEAIPGTKESHPELFSIYGKVALTGEPTQFELYFKPLGIWFTISVYSSQKGYFVTVFENITERKQAEAALRQTQEQLVRSEKLAAIGQLAGGVGHELRNPLGAIKNAVYYIKGKVAKSELAQREPRLMEFLDIMNDEVNASNKIITDLLGFSRVGRPSVSPARIEKVIEDALSHLTIPENIELTKKLDVDLPKVEIDADQIRQVWVNIIMNAVQAMPEGGKLTIGAREKGKFLEVEIADTGGGIPQEVGGKIFDPLFTTKAKGIGFGLAVCKAIIDRHQGNIEVESQVGKGTTFIIKLPLKVE